MVKTTRTNLQTIEARFATQSDFTILILNSPGAFAELGTFSMIPDIKSRLFVFVPMQFYGAKSYIARGPLSLLAESHVQNIYYYDSSVQIYSAAELFFPVSLSKIARQLSGPEYVEIALRSRSVSSFVYETFIAEYRTRYFDIICYMAVLTADNPTFIDLVTSTKLPARTISSSLSRLFSSSRIKKNKLGQYFAAKGYADDILSPIDTRKLSKLRAIAVPPT